jgi:hypothetical protein
MKKYCTSLIILFLYAGSAYGQTFFKIPRPVPLAATLNIGNNTVTIDSTNQAAPGSQCGITSAEGFWIGNGLANSYTYQFQKPISQVKINITGINQSEEIRLSFNNQPYTITSSDITAYPGSCNLATTYLTQNGALISNSSGLGAGENAQLNIIFPASVFSLELSENYQPGTGGSVYEIYFVNDTCYVPFTAIANTPCEGGELQLSVDSIPNVTQYDWIRSSAVISSDRNHKIANAQLSDAGTYFVTATHGNCQYSSSVNVSVNTSPTPLANTTTNNGPLCPGNTLQLSTGAITGVTYSWTGPNNFTSTAQNPSSTNISSLAEGRYYVRTVSNTNGCESKPDSTDLVLYYPTAPPVASGDILVCRGTDIHLFASTIPGVTYEWTGPNNFYSTLQNPVRTGVTYIDSGDYYVIAKLNGCSSKSDTVHTSIKVLTPNPGAISNSPVCPGTNIVFTSNTINNATYSWTGPNFSSTLQNPVIPGASIQSAGNYYVTATVNGCISDTQTLNVVIAILAATPKAGNDGPVCPGKTLQLTSNTIPNASYEWKGPNFTSANQNPTIPNVTTDNAGTYYLYSIVNGCKSLPDSTIVKVEISTPTPDGQSNSPICRGAELKLSTSDIPNAVYEWKGPGNFLSSIQNPVINKTGANDSGYYIVVANVDGCRSLPDTVWVAYKPMPDITSSSSNSPVCEGDSIELRAKGYIQNETVVYTWTGPEGFNTAPLARTVRGDVIMNMAGKYSVSAYYDGCFSDTQSIDVVIKPKPAQPEILATPEKLRLGETLNVSALNVSPGVAYSWICPDGIERKDTAFTIADLSKAAEGDYIFTVTLDGCSSTAKKYVFVSDRETFTLFPNPNNGSFTVKITLKKDRKVPIEVINPMGQVIYRDASETKNKLMIKTINLGENLINGVYILRLGLDGHTRDMRFVILR